MTFPIRDLANDLRAAAAPYLGASMPVNSLIAELRVTLAEINMQIGAIKQDLEKQIAVLPYPEHVNIYQMTNRDGNYPLTNLLVAKANCLQGIATLQASKKK